MAQLRFPAVNARACSSHDVNSITAGTAFTGIKSANLYPSVGMKKPGEHLKVNFGQTQFVFDIDSLVDVSIPFFLDQVKLS
jgi:hypothetical protein